MIIAVEMDGSSPRYATVHKAGCRDLSDGEVVGDAASLEVAVALVEDFTGWEPDYVFAPCVKFGGAK